MWMYRTEIYQRKDKISAKAQGTVFLTYLTREPGRSRGDVKEEESHEGNSLDRVPLLEPLRGLWLLL